MKLGYVRVSSQDQNEERQIRQLNEIGMDFIYKEKVSGATINREKLNEMINNLKAGDTIYVIQNEQHARRIVEEMAKERKIPTSNILL